MFSLDAVCSILKDKAREYVPLITNNPYNNFGSLNSGYYNYDSLTANIDISVAVSGATTIAAIDDNGTTVSSSITSGANTLSRTFVLSGLNAGVNTFTLKYRVSAGTFSFFTRDITIIPLN